MLLLKKSLVIVAAGLSVHVQTVNALGAFFCNDINWTNDCAHWKPLGPNECYTLDAGHQDKVSSFGPDSGTACYLYPDYHCSSGYRTTPLQSPGSADLRDVDYHGIGLPPVTVNDNMNSFQCWDI